MVTSRSEKTIISFYTHDEVKDKMFELELSWVSEATTGKHERVPAHVQEAAEKFAKESLEDDSDDSGDEM